jgi:hypothetical protein
MPGPDKSKTNWVKETDEYPGTRGDTDKKSMLGAKVGREAPKVAQSPKGGETPKEAAASWDKEVAGKKERADALDDAWHESMDIDSASGQALGKLLTTVSPAVRKEMEDAIRRARNNYERLTADTGVAHKARTEADRERGEFIEEFGYSDYDRAPKPPFGGIKPTQSGMKAAAQSAMKKHGLKDDEEE